MAREVTGDEKNYYWGVAEKFWPHYPEYRRLAQGRDIPVMVLEPRSQNRDQLEKGRPNMSRIEDW